MGGLFDPVRDVMRAARRSIIEPGNIDINKRRVVLNPDGTYSTEESMSFGDETGAEIVIPTVVNGRHLSQDAAIENYYRTGQHLGKFADPNVAELFAEGLHNRQERKYGPIAEALMKRAK